MEIQPEAVRHADEVLRGLTPQQLRTPTSQAFSLNPLNGEPADSCPRLNHQPHFPTDLR